MLVRPGAAEAVVEARFVGLRPALEDSPLAAGTQETAAGDWALGGGEVVMSRVVPADGRSRAYLDGRMATVSALAEQGGRLVDLHGQHAHQSLFSAGAQRAALDSYAGVQHDAHDAARAEVRQLQAAMAGAGGDAAARARERELLRYQLAELDAVGLQGADEDDRLADEKTGWARLPSTGRPPRWHTRAWPARTRCSTAWARWSAPPPGTHPSPPCTNVFEAWRRSSPTQPTRPGRRADFLQEDPERLEEVVARRSVLKGVSGASTPARPAAWAR